MPLSGDCDSSLASFRSCARILLAVSFTAAVTLPASCEPPATPARGKRVSPSSTSMVVESTPRMSAAVCARIV